MCNSLCTFTYNILKLRYRWNIVCWTLKLAKESHRMKWDVVFAHELI